MHSNATRIACSRSQVVHSCVSSTTAITSNGASAGEVVRAVWGSIAGGATSVASRAGGAVRDGAKSVLDGARGLFK